MEKKSLILCANEDYEVKENILFSVFSEWNIEVTFC